MNLTVWPDANSQVEVLAEVGDWLKVRWHKRAKEKTRKDPSSAGKGDAGGDLSLIHI